MGPQNLKFRILNSFLLKVTDMKFHQDWLSPSKVIQGKRSDGRWTTDGRRTDDGRTTDGRPPPSIYGRVRNFFISKFIPSYSLRKFASLTCSARRGINCLFYLQYDVVIQLDKIQCFEICLKKLKTHFFSLCIAFKWFEKTLFYPPASEASERSELA